MFNTKRKRVDKKGYIQVNLGCKGFDKWVFEHRLVCEELLNRNLTNLEVVHHIDLNRANNRPENLAIFPSQDAHQTFHIKLIKFPYLTNPMIRELNEIKLINLVKCLK